MARELFHDIAPEAAIADIAAAIPESCKKHFIIIGSLAAGYHFFKNQSGMAVRTKDADCLLAPQEVAVEQAHEVANVLLKHGWVPYFTHGMTFGDDATPADRLPVIRLRPHDHHPWFIELITSTSGEKPKEYVPVSTDRGRMALAAFPFIGVTSFEPIGAFGIRVAQPSMMALSNLLNHRTLTSHKMTEPIGDRILLRCSKDLGRVLAMGYLQLKQQQDITWGGDWVRALTHLFPEKARDYGLSCGEGFKALLASPHHMSEAHHSCVHGLLTRHHVDERTLLAVGERLVADVFDPLATLLA